MGDIRCKFAPAVKELTALKVSYDRSKFDRSKLGVVVGVVVICGVFVVVVVVAVVVVVVVVGCWLLVVGCWLLVGGGGVFFIFMF